jgi:hypothetical protein
MENRGRRLNGAITVPLVGGVFYKIKSVPSPPMALDGLTTVSQTLRRLQAGHTHLV